MYNETDTGKKLEIFRERLKALRGEARLQDVAKDIGISRASLGYYENGDSWQIIIMYPATTY